MPYAILTVLGFGVLNVEVYQIACLGLGLGLNFNPNFFDALLFHFPIINRILTNEDL